MDTNPIGKHFKLTLTLRSRHSRKCSYCCPLCPAVIQIYSHTSTKQDTHRFHHGFTDKGDFNFISARILWEQLVKWSLNSDGNVTQLWPEALKRWHVAPTVGVWWGPAEGRGFAHQRNIWFYLWLFLPHHTHTHTYIHSNSIVLRVNF